MVTKMPESLPLAPGLYIVATPIGNLRDITLRALDVLAGADLLVCEDTRVTGKLVEALGLPKKKMLSYNDHNADSRRGGVLAALAEGKSVALASDAGMPLVSDPGYKLVRDCLDLGIQVTTVPGPSAVLAALQLSGLPPDKFVFLGFLPPKTAARKKFLAAWAAVPATLVAFETGPRLASSLADMAEVLGADRPAAVAREITKKFEESRRDTLSRLAAMYSEEDPPKGEIVVVIGPPEEKAVAADDLDARIKEALKGMSVRDAAAFVAQATGAPKKKVYERALALGKDNDRG